MSQVVDELLADVVDRDRFGLTANLPSFGARPSPPSICHRMTISCTRIPLLEDGSGTRSSTSSSLSRYSPSADLLLWAPATSPGSRLRVRLAESVIGPVAGRGQTACRRSRGEQAAGGLAWCRPASRWSRAGGPAVEIQTEEDVPTPGKRPGGSARCRWPTGRRLPGFRLATFKGMIADHDQPVGSQPTSQGRRRELRRPPPHPHGRW